MIDDGFADVDDDSDAPSGSDASPTNAPPAWAASGGANIDQGADDDAAFIAGARRSPFKDMLATVTSSRRNMAIAGGGAALLLLVCMLAFCGGESSNKPKQVAAKTPAVDKAPAKPEPAPEPAPEPVAKAPPAAEPPAPAEPAEASGPTAEELAAAAADSGEPDATTKPAATPGTKREGTKSGASTTVAATTMPAKKDTIGGKQVVLEYDTQAREAKPVAAGTGDQAAISKARTAYAAGNQRLFAGDPSGAIKFYRQSLGFYPGYVAGYRGLGLAYAQQGDKPKALQALRTYVSSVPTAKDTPLIRKRISSLQGK